MEEEGEGEQGKLIELGCVGWTWQVRVCEGPENARWGKAINPEIPDC